MVDRLDTSRSFFIPIKSSEQRDKATSFVSEVIEIDGVQEVRVVTPGDGSASKIFVIARGKGLVPDRDISERVNEIGNRVIDNGMSVALKYRVVTSQATGRILPEVRGSKLKTVWRRPSK